MRSRAQGLVANAHGLGAGATQAGSVLRAGEVNRYRGWRERSMRIGYEGGQRALGSPSASTCVELQSGLPAHPFDDLVECIRDLTGTAIGQAGQ